MEADLIIINEYCRKINLEPSFFDLLEENDLITIFIEEGERYFPSSELNALEKYIRLYYDLSINMEGIDVIRNLQNRIQALEDRINLLRQRLKIYESDVF
ncbi:MAG: chaperone modulator CbpM [Tannerella sp.]|jgi:hypothetical protein|nr:chaperone modulator CbpM [Tannerella sp.]